MIFEAATGRRPFHGETVFAVAAARLLSPPPDPRALRPDLPAGLGALVQRAMARRPEDRFASAAEVASALAALTPSALSTGGPGGERGSSPAQVVTRISATPPRSAERILAVLPFRNAGPPDQAYVAEGITEDVIDQLSMVPGLRVRSRGVVMRYKDSDRDPREVGRELDVHVVVDGTVRRTGGGVRIGARMASVADGIQIWAKRFDRPEAELLQVADDVARAIAEALAVETGPSPRTLETDPEALDLYLRGRAAYHAVFDAIERSALPLFEQAMARAPDDPRILAGYAMARARVWSDDPEEARAASAAAARAVALAPGSPHAHVALASVDYQAGEVVGPVRSLRRALRLSPQHSDAHDLLGRIISDAGLLPEARRHLTTALALDPDATLARLALGRVYELTGEPDEADRLTAERHETSAFFARLVMWRRDRGRAAELLRTAPLTGPAGARTRLLLEAMAGGPPPYDAFASLASRATVRLGAFFAQLETEVAAFAGDHPRALAALTRTADAGTFDVAWADGCPLLQPLRAHPIFAEARARIAARADRAIAAYREP
jgi:serine/threonine-protein kinase